jgi:predicted DNA binding protein
MISTSPGRSIFDQLVEVPKMVKHDQCSLKTWSRANNNIVVTPIDPSHLEVQYKKKIKSGKVLLDLVKDHLIHHLSKKKTTKNMFDSLVGLFQSTNMNRNLVLMNKIISV